MEYKMELNKIDFSAEYKDTNNKLINDCAIELYAGTAQEAAKFMAGNYGDKNKPTQIRKFYDELVMWDERISLTPEEYNQNIPLIKMMRAKVAYAKGRKHIDDNFEKIFNHCMSQVNSPETLHKFKLFFEAVMGYYKVVKTEAESE